MADLEALIDMAATLAQEILTFPGQRPSALRLELGMQKLHQALLDAGGHRSTERLSTHIRDILVCADEVDTARTAAEVSLQPIGLLGRQLLTNIL